MRNSISFFLLGIILILNYGAFCQTNSQQKCISGDCVNGNGTYRFSNGIYTGEWKDGLINGFGIYSWTMQDKYEGYWEGGKRSGFGTLTWANGYHFEGQWLNDQRNGEGILFDKDGQVVKKGNWIDDVFQFRITGYINPCKLPISPELITISLQNTTFETKADYNGMFTLEFPEKIQPVILDFSSPLVFPRQITLEGDTLIELCLERKVRKGTLAVPVYGPVLYGRSIDRTYIKAAAFTDLIGILSFTYALINYGNYDHKVGEYNAELDRYPTLTNIMEINESQQLMNELYSGMKADHNKYIAGTITGSAFIAASIAIRIIAIVSPNYPKGLELSIGPKSAKSAIAIQAEPYYSFDTGMPGAMITIRF